MGKKRPSSSDQKVIGFLLIVLGGLFLLDTLDFLNFGRFIGEWWPLILIIIGLSKFRGGRQPGGGILLVIGIVFLSATLGIINWDRIWRFWPLVLIAIGLQIVFRGRSGLGRKSMYGHEVKDDYFNLSGIFGGGDHRIISDKLTGGEATVLFGGLDIDLTDSQLEPDECTFSFTAIFGGIELRVPDDWRVITSGTPIFGGLTNKTGRREQEYKKTVKVVGTVLFGGVDVKN